MKAKVWFHGLGQKHSRNDAWVPARVWIAMPKWARLAYRNGYISIGNVNNETIRYS